MKKEGGLGEKRGEGRKTKRDREKWIKKGIKTQSRIL